MKHTILTAAFITSLSIASISSAQSILSFEYPVGIPVSLSSGPSLSLGRSGVGLQNEFLAMSRNVANIGGLEASVFSTALAYDFVTINSGNKSETNSKFNPQMLSFAFPLKHNLGAIGISLEQKSNFALKFNSTTSTTINNTTYTELMGVKRSGGLSNWQIGYAYKIKRIGSIGLSYERVYLSDKLNRYKTITGLIQSTQKDSISISSQVNGIRGGLLVPYKNFTAGLSGEYFFIDDIKIKDTISTLDYPIPTQKSRLKLAPSIAVGASYQFNPEWFVAADIGLMLWDEFYDGLYSARKLDNAPSFSFGAQYIPAPNLLAPKFYEIIQYRAGFRFAQMPVKTAKEYAFDLGVGLPIQQKTSYIDINFEIGSRSDSYYKDFSETFFSIQFGLNGSKKWYQATGTSY
jgi:long-subunit fatty acid transport protein